MAAVAQPRQRVVDLVGWKIWLQGANEFAAGPAAFTDCGRQRTIKLAVQEELLVLGIEAHGMRRQQIDGEIRRELRNVLGVERRAVLACHAVGARASTLTAPSPIRHWKPCSPV